MPTLHFSALTTLLGQIVAIVVASRLLGAVLRRVGQPLVMAEVLAGILLGPSLFGLLWPDAMATVFPTSSFPLLKMLSQVGLVLFMFLVGLELDPSLLRGRTRSSIIISHTSIVFPFALGAVSAFQLSEAYSSPEVSLTAFALFLGISMSVTAFPVLARILSERNLMTSHVGAIALACAAVDDVTAWCLLALVIGVVRAGALLDGLWTTALAATFIVVMLFGVRPLLARLARRIGVRDGLNSNVVAIILLFLLTSSAITELIGIHALFGAFLFGAILPKDGNLAEILIEKLETVSVVLLLPLFFAFSGLRTEIGLVDNAQDWIVTAALIAIASVGKFGGSTIAARLTGLRWREASAIGILMNTRGLMELIVLNIGLDLGVISPTIFTMLVLMALVTTFATTPILRWVYPPSEVTRTPLVGSIPVEGPMTAPLTVLMCIADDASGVGMVTAASGLLGTNGQGKLIALHLSVPTDRPSVARRRRETSEQVGPMAATLAQARALQLDVRAVEFVSTDPATDICRTADSGQTSLILLGAHRPLLFEGHLGGTVKKVIGQAKSPVAVFFDRGLTKLERVLVVYTGPHDVGALRAGAAFASKVRATILEVGDRRPPKISPEGSEADALLRTAAAMGAAIRKVDVDVDLVAEATGYDLVVIGMTARRVAPSRERMHEFTSSVLHVHPAVRVEDE